MLFCVILVVVGDLLVGWGHVVLLGHCPFYAFCGVATQGTFHLGFFPTTPTIPRVTEISRTCTATIHAFEGLTSGAQCTA